MKDATRLARGLVTARVVLVTAAIIADVVVYLELETA
jgi:hypothetical protein